MIKAIFFDIDGTLVNSNSRAHETTKAAINEAQSKGILCGVATGRSPVKLEKLIDCLNLDMFVVYNGQLVYTHEKDIFAEAFSKEVLDEIVDYAETNHRQISFGGRYKLDGSASVRMGNSRWAKRIARLLPRTFPPQAVKQIMQKLSFNRGKERFRHLKILQQPIYQCILISPESEKEKVKRMLPRCAFQRSNPFSVDVIPAGGSKVKGIEAFIQSQGIKASEVMAFGDNYNDMEMLEYVGVGVAMGNAKDEVKAIADFVTHSNEKDGIAYAMKSYGVIEGELDAKNEV